MSIDDPYLTLGVTREHSLDEIKRSFYALAHKHHPDKGGDAEVFKKMSAAWAFLQQRHIQRPKGHKDYTAAASTSSKRSPHARGIFYEYDPETARWYSHNDVDKDGFVMPTTTTTETEEEFKAKAKKLRESRLGHQASTQDFYNKFK